MHNFDETKKQNIDDFDNTNIKSIKFVKKFNVDNKNIIEIYKRIEKYSGYFGSTENEDQLVIYFCYIKCNYMSPTPICQPPPAPIFKKRSTLFGGPQKDPQLIEALRNNKQFLNRKKTVEYNDVSKQDMEDEYLLIDAILNQERTGNYEKRLMEDDELNYEKTLMEADKLFQKSNKN